MATLGFAEIEIGNRNRGAVLAHDGVDLLTSGVAKEPERLAFLVRAKSRLGTWDIRRGRLRTGLKEWLDACDLAEAAQLQVPLPKMIRLVLRPLTPNRSSDINGAQ
jgi:hypothetical protein